VHFGFCGNSGCGETLLAAKRFFGAGSRPGIRRPSRSSTGGGEHLRSPSDLPASAAARPMTPSATSEVAIRDGG